MVAGIVVSEVLYPLEGFRGSGRAIFNDTMCLDQLAGIHPKTFDGRNLAKAVYIPTKMCIIIL